jgi:hypothetical protein
MLAADILLSITAIILLQNIQHYESALLDSHCV